MWFEISWFAGMHADARNRQRVCLDKSQKQTDRATVVLALL